MKKTFIKLSAVAAFALTFGVSTVASAAEPAVKVVTKDNMQGWALNADPDNIVDYAFVDGNASIGTGSLQVGPITNTNNGGKDKFIALHALGVPTADLDSISFDYKLAEGVAPEQANQFYLNVYTNLPGSASYYDCKYDFVGTLGSSTGYTTLTFDSTVAPTTVTAGTSVASCPATLAEMPEGSVVSGFAINVGDTSTNDQGVGGYLDNVVVTVNGVSTTYDFERTVPAEPKVLGAKDDCKNSGWVEGETVDGKKFKNQGQCVAYFQSSASSKHHRMVTMPTLRY